MIPKITDFDTEEEWYAWMKANADRYINTPKSKEEARKRLIEILEEDDEDDE